MGNILDRVAHSGSHPISIVLHPVHGLHSSQEKHEY